MSEWVKLVGSDGKVKASLNKVTGELVIKERGEFHHWNVLDLCGVRVQKPISDLLEGQTVKTAY